MRTMSSVTLRSNFPFKDSINMQLDWNENGERE